MKTYSIINGTSLYIINASDSYHAKDKAIAICDHSKEIIIREITHIDIFTKINEETKL